MLGRACDCARASVDVTIHLEFVAKHKTSERPEMIDTQLDAFKTCVNETLLAKLGNNHTNTAIHLKNSSSNNVLAIQATVTLGT